MLPFEVDVDVGEAAAAGASAAAAGAEYPSSADPDAEADAEAEADASETSDEAEECWLVFVDLSSPLLPPLPLRLLPPFFLPFIFFLNMLIMLVIVVDGQSSGQ